MRTNRHAPDAYDYAIRAIECAFRQTATPDNPTDDLGVILAHWEKRPDTWNSRFPFVFNLEPMMGLLDGLWQKLPQPDDRRTVWMEDARIVVTIAEASS